MSWLDIVAYTSNYSLGFTARPCLENKIKKLKTSNQNNKTKSTKCVHLRMQKIQKQSKQTNKKTPQNKKRASSHIKRRPNLGLSYSRCSICSDKNTVPFEWLNSRPQPIFSRTYSSLRLCFLSFNKVGSPAG